MKFKNLEINISGEGPNSTQLNLMVNGNLKVFDSPFGPDEMEEERLINTIKRYI